MSVLEGLGAYKARKAEEEARREAASRPKINRFNLVKDGDSAVIRFAQEIDPDASNYNADRGIGFVNIEHNHPDPNVGWMNRANCSNQSQGDCLPCRLRADETVDWEHRKGWKQKEKFYVNVIGGEAIEVDNPNAKGKNKKAWLTTDIDRKTGDGEVFLLEQGTFNGIWDSLVAYALDEDSGATITSNFFKITRKGNLFNDTSYVLTPLKEIPAAAKSLDDFELIDIRTDVLREIPFNQQEAFYFKGVSVAEAAPAWEDEKSEEKVGTSAGW